MSRMGVDFMFVKNHSPLSPWVMGARTFCIM